MILSEFNIYRLVTVCFYCQNLAKFCLNLTFRIIESKLDLNIQKSNPIKIKSNSDQTPYINLLH